MIIKQSHSVTHDGSDLWLLNEAIDLCQAGQQFYAQATKGVIDYNIKRIFSHMAEVRKGMLSRLTALFKQVEPRYPQVIDSIDHLTPPLSPYYAEAEKAIAQNRMTKAIKVLITAEQYVLSRLKLAAKRANSQRVTRQLAEGIAWLQISCDSMKNLPLNESSQSP
ncbi:glutamyl-tRNA reductase [Shewanella phaeophyticola]|uniref:Glutamyl-tRNA reductase n=1 Tax=Shewanella phaeophyticola TaxID=2978345 RepID=A0ABT2P6R6_9GAMM|nr:glutamyl-tRNA reductase [Shewanella sp. KJ10-1]MCT8988348.1 glutamyl-tRNA reductase [Shewanella sp. KJ10-1]